MNRNEEVTDGKAAAEKIPSITEKVFDRQVMRHAWVQFYEPKRKVDNMIWTLKHAKRPNIVKHTLTEVLYDIVFRHSGPLMQIAVP